jgi:hypothetical protein
VTAVDVGADGQLWRQFGLAAMQRARAVRLLREIHRQGGWASLGEIATLLNLTPTALSARLRPLQQAGVWLPHLRAWRAREGQLPLEAWIVDRLLAGESGEAIRELAALTVAELESVHRRAVALWRGVQGGMSAAQRAPSLALSAHEAEAIVEVVRGRHRQRLWKDWERSYRWGEATPQGHDADPMSVLEAEHGMSRVAARLFLQRLDELSAQLTSSGSDTAGALVFFAISAEEGARTQLEEAKLVPVRLSYLIDEDRELGPRGRHRNRVSDLKFARIVRYCGEARAQGALLTLPDVSMLLGIHVAVIQRLLGAHPEVVVPTRGRIKDIGRGVTHRRQIVELYLQMHTESEVVLRTGHSYQSVEAYLQEFARMVTLVDKGLTAPLIRRVTGRSMALVRSYLELYRLYDRPEYQFRLAQLRRVFAREEALAQGGKKRGPGPTAGGPR